MYYWNFFSFQETLFPYVLKNVEEFITSNWDSDSVKTSINELREQSKLDTEAKMDGVIAIIDDDEKTALIESIVKSVKWLMSNDRKVGALKTLQGLIWEKGYKDGAIKGQ